MTDSGQSNAVAPKVPMPELLWEHLREVCSEKSGEPKLFVTLNGHRCEKCAGIIRWGVEGRDVEGVTI